MRKHVHPAAKELGIQSARMTLDTYAQSITTAKILAQEAVMDLLLFDSLPADKELALAAFGVKKKPSKSSKLSARAITAPYG